MIKILFFATGYSSTFCSEYEEFITKELFYEKNISINCLNNLSEIDQINENFDIFVYRCRDPQNYIWRYVPTYEDALKCVLKYKPKIIIQLADEYYFENLQEHNQLAKHCKLFLRQFNYSNYEYFQNTVQIPLGYYNSFEIDSRIIKTIGERKLNWSFIGCQKSDRRECVETFSLIENNFIHLQEDGIPQQISREEMLNIYLDSVFIPCSRGWTQLETNRIYESLICGAIPVIVCGEEEYNVVFQFYGNCQEKPLFIRENSWIEAVDKCKKLLDTPDELQKMQEYNIDWFNNMVLSTRKLIEESL